MNIQSMEVIVTDKRTHIIETAMKLFVTQGLQQTSMAQLSKVSGIAVGTMYHHFKSKDELIVGIFLHIQEDFGKAIALDQQELNMPYRKKFELILRKSYKYYTSNPNYFFFIDTHNYSPNISPETTLEARSYYSQALEILMAGVSNGNFKEIQPNLMIRWVYNGIISLVQINLCDSIEVTEAMMEQTINMIWEGLT